MSGERRVVVTGLGAVTPLGADMETTWRRLVAGKGGAGPITAFGTSGHSVRIAAEASDFEPERWLDRKTIRKIDRFAQFAVAAARMAERDAGLDIAPEPDRIGASIATAQGGVASLAECLRELGESQRIHPSLVTAFMPNMAAGWVSMELGTRGPLGAPCTACAASAMAIGDGYDAIRLGRAEVMLCGGSEAGITELAIAGFAAMRALSCRNSDPAGASRPFDADRDGFVMGEGAAVLVLEELEHALARGAKIYAELAGYGVSSDSFHMTEPDPLGAGQARAVCAALADAALDPTDVDYVNAHASSTGLGDAIETRALKLAFGEEKVQTIPVSGTKGATGHCLGAAGAVEAAFTVLAVNRDIVPPTINYETPDPACDVDCVPNEARQLPVRVALSNSFGFGGHNAVLIMRKFVARPELQSA
jgi:3-oxoacyl-[acyl-carrier-protein] synthase II